MGCHDDVDDNHDHYDNRDGIHYTNLTFALMHQDNADPSLLCCNAFIPICLQILNAARGKIYHL